RATYGSNASNASANQAFQKFGSVGRNRSDGFANQASRQPSNPYFNNAMFAPPSSPPPVAAHPDRNANSSPSPNPPVQPQPTKNASANSPTCASGQASPVPTLFGRVGAQKPQTGPENPAKTQITPSTFRKRQADDQSSTLDPSQDALHPKKLLKREPSDESRINQAKANSTPATNANPPDFVFSSSWTSSKEVQSVGSKIKELQEEIKKRDRTILRRRELNAWREERRQKLSARRAICQNELKECYDKLKETHDNLAKIQKEEEDLEEQFREKTS
ncbi:hypothetical protein QBC37DRAFT_449438, partial [Rhypophila decipiens]